MNGKYMLELKPVISSNPETNRIYEITKDTCNRFNIYLADFFETVSILSEKKGRPGQDIQEIEESITYVRKKIDELLFSMENIAKEMPSLVILKVEQTSSGH